MFVPTPKLWKNEQRVHPKGLQVEVFQLEASKSTSNQSNNTVMLCPLLQAFGLALINSSALIFPCGSCLDTSVAREKHGSPIDAP